MNEKDKRLLERALSILAQGSVENELIASLTLIRRILKDDGKTVADLIVSPTKSGADTFDLEGDDRAIALKIMQLGHVMLSARHNVPAVQQTLLRVARAMIGNLTVSGDDMRATLGSMGELISSLMLEIQRVQLDSQRQHMEMLMHNYLRPGNRGTSASPGLTEEDLRRQMEMIRSVFNSA